MRLKTDLFLLKEKYFSRTFTGLYLSPLLIDFYLTNHFLTEALEKPVLIYDIIGLQVYNYTVKIRILLYR